MTHEHMRTHTHTTMSQGLESQAGQWPVPMLTTGSDLHSALWPIESLQIPVSPNLDEGNYVMRMKWIVTVEWVLCPGARRSKNTGALVLPEKPSNPTAHADESP